MTTPEGKVKEAVKKVLKARNIWYYMPVQNGMGIVGIPDIIACWNGWFVGIETKGPGKKGTVTPNQQQRLYEIQKHGGLALVIDDVNELVTILDDIERMKQELRNGQKVEEPKGEEGLQEGVRARPEEAHSVQDGAEQEEPRDAESGNSYEGRW